MIQLHYHSKTPARLGHYLKTALPGLPTGRLHKYLRENKIKLNGAKPALTDRLRDGDEIRLYLPPEAEAAALCPPAGPAPVVLYEDTHFIAVDKPAGLVCRADTPNAPSLEAAVQAAHRQENAPDSTPPSLCHRLDTGTSGVVLLAKTPEALALSEQLMREHLLRKEYLCVTVGAPSPRTATLNAYLSKDAKQGRVRVLNSPQRGAKPITTRYETLETSGRLALLRVELVTGRTHQIRAQLAHVGAPILGDSKYGQLAINRELRCKYQCLCAKAIQFPQSLPAVFSALEGRRITCQDPWYIEQLYSKKLK